MLVTDVHKQEKMELVMLEKIVPEDHLLRLIDKYIDFSFINDLCAPYYCKDTEDLQLSRKSSLECFS